MRLSTLVLIGGILSILMLPLHGLSQTDAGQFNVLNASVKPTARYSYTRIWSPDGSATMNFNVSGYEASTGQYKFTVTPTGPLTLTFYGVIPIGVNTVGIKSIVTGGEQIVYANGQNDNLCLDYVGGICGVGPGGGGGGGGGGGAGGGTGGGSIAGVVNQASSSPLFFPILLLSGLTGFIVFIGIISRPKRRTS